MGFFHTLKQKIRSLVPVSRTYMDNKLRELEKANKQQVKILTELQKNTAQELKDYIANEFSRREDWAKRAVQIQQDAKDRPIWVIKCPAPEGEKKVRWGDYAYAVALKRYLDRMGKYAIIDLHEDWDCEVNADVVLVLRGREFYRPDRRNTKCLYIMWNISHPEMVTEEEYKLYDIICVGSLHYAKELQQKLDIPVYPLLQCTDTELFYPDKEAEVNRGKDYLFIGNSRGVARPCVLWAAKDKLPLKIWGAGWKAMLGPDKSMVQDVFIENSEIPALYRSAKVTLNDHWKDMLDYQFVNNRIFDALACGLPVISDCCDELREIFPDAVLYYSNKEEFEDCVKRIETDYDAVKAKVDAQWPMIKEKYSFEARAKELVEIVEKYRTENSWLQ
ncbi:glycosyltransferase family protein [Blautia sp. HCP3S3_H10_1]|uniref:glycosyltransferase family protein n=1 Tax=unclassified Blautia TaxID=2648079 RepID=UPI003F9324B4